MDIAVTGLSLPLLGPDLARQQSRTDNEQSSRARNNRNTQTTQDNSTGRTSTERSSNERVITGEVIYARPEPVRFADTIQRTSTQAGTGFNSPQTRRFSLQAAIQTFRDNEALITDPRQPRQVSGIIDEYV